MTIIRKNFPSVIKDNEEVYFKLLEGVISSLDELSSMEINRTLHSYTFRIATSTPQYSQPLLEEIINFHKFIGIQLDLSKSIKANSTIFYQINLDNKN